MEIFDRALKLLLDKDMNGFTDLFAVDATVEFPFAEGSSPRSLSGREELRAYLAGYPDLVDIKEFPSVVVHETGDPEVIIAEFTARGVAVRSGRPYEVDYIAVIRVRHGEIVSYRDYWNPLAMARTMSGPRILVTGGTGTTGSRLAALLRAEGIDVRVASRSSAVRFDWTDPATYASTLDGIDRVYLVAPIGVADPAPLVADFLDQARAAGVRRVVLLSSSVIPSSAPGLDKIRLAVRDMPEWAVLRPSWFMQNVTGRHAVSLSIRERGEIVTATGAGRVGFVDADDIAAVAARALLDTDAPNTEYVLTGPQALSYTELAALISDLGRPTRHVQVSDTELVEHLAAGGIPEEFGAILAEAELMIRAGVEDRTTSTVLDVTGRPPRTFRDFLLAVDDAS